jgi:hypothetical protein
MAKKTTLVVVTPVGTFTRTTARTYSHVVTVSHYRAELREQQRLAALANAKRQLARYLRTIETGQCQDARPGASGDWDRECTAKFLADGSYTEFVASTRATIADLESQGVITEDAHPTPGVIGWCGRLDLALKLAATERASYRHVQIFEVATGRELGATTTIEARS